MTEIAKTITSPDRKRRVHILRRGDGLFQFSEEILFEDEDQGQKYSIWKPQYPPSGVFPDEHSAELEARLTFKWLEDLRSE
jgi:hypothetical protein